MSKQGNIKVNHSIGHSAESMMALVGDVPNYSKFLPWVKAVKIWDKSVDNNNFSAELMIGYKSIRIPFSTRVTIDNNNNIIKTSLLNVKKGFSLLPSPLKSLECSWQFVPDTNNNDACIINLSIDYEFGDPILAALIMNNINKVTSRLIDAFSAEANVRYA